MIATEAPPIACQRERHRSCGDAGLARDRGSSSIQMLFLLPVLFSVMFLGMQAALYYHARTVAMAAAQEGARAAGGELGSVGLGQEAAESFLFTVGDGVLEDGWVTTQRDATSATVVVGGTSMSVIPGWDVTVEQSATAPVERITG